MRQRPSSVSRDRVRDHAGTCQYHVLPDDVVRRTKMLHDPGDVVHEVVPRFVGGSVDLKLGVLHHQSCSRGGGPEWEGDPPADESPEE